MKIEAKKNHGDCCTDILVDGAKVGVVPDNGGDILLALKQMAEMLSAPTPEPAPKPARSKFPPPPPLPTE